LDLGINQCMEGVQDMQIQSVGEFLLTCLTSLLTLGALFLLAKLMGSR
jgi:hypothetical protein